MSTTVQIAVGVAAGVGLVVVGRWAYRKVRGRRVVRPDRAALDRLRGLAPTVTQGAGPRLTLASRPPTLPQTRNLARG